MKLILSLGVLAVILAGPVEAAVAVRDFARFEDFQNLKLSPNGDYVAATKPLDGMTALAVVRLSDGAVTAGLKFGRFDHVSDFWWAGPERVLVTIAIREGPFAAPRDTGELVGIDADGKRKKYLFGFRGSARKGSRVEAGNTYFNAWAEMVDPLPRDPTWALIKVTSWGADRPYHELFRLNEHTGERRQELRPPVEYISYYLTDGEGRVRYAAGSDVHYNWRSYARDLESGGWSKIEQADLANAKIAPWNYSHEENAAYFASNELDGDRYCLIRQDLASGKRSPVACDPAQSLARAINSVDGSRPIAAVFEAGKPEIRILAPESEDGKMLAGLMNTFPDQSLSGLSFSRDGSKVLFGVFSDRNPGAYYILDRARAKVKRLFTARPWIDPSQMAERRPLAFKARDGRPIHAYLTFPPGRKPQAMPLIVYPHGGPLGVRDHWGWDADAQLLASRGYAVLQVNFRGSSGYGDAHREAGRKNWGAGMIDDVTDGVRYVIQEGFADPRRVCIYGASYGGYAALMSAVREPDMYRCVVAYAGVYDLVRFKAESDIADTRRGENYLLEFVADTPEAAKAQSPINYLDQLKAPVLIVHGEGDKRAPFSQANLLRKALDERNHPYEWLSKPEEEHGFYKEENRVEFYERMLAFLGKHLGDGAQGPPVHQVTAH